MPPSIPQQRDFIRRSVQSGHWLRAVLVLRARLCTQPWRPPPANTALATPPSSSSPTTKFPSAFESYTRHIQQQSGQSHNNKGAEESAQKTRPAAVAEKTAIKSSLSSLSARSRLKSNIPISSAAASTPTNNTPPYTSNGSSASSSTASTSPSSSGFAQSDSEGGVDSALKVGFGFDSIDCGLPLADSSPPSPSPPAAPHQCRLSFEERVELLCVGCSELLPTLLKLSATGPDTSSVPAYAAEKNAQFLEEQQQTKLIPAVPLRSASPLAALYLLVAAAKYDVLCRLPMSLLHETLTQLVMPLLSLQLPIASEGGVKAAEAGHNGKVCAKSMSMAHELLWPLFCALVEASSGGAKTSLATSRNGDGPARDSQKSSSLSLDEVVRLVSVQSTDANASDTLSGGSAPFSTFTNAEHFQFLSGAAAKVLSTVVEAKQSLSAGPPPSSSFQLVSSEAVAILFTMSLGPELFARLVLGHAVAGDDDHPSEALVSDWETYFAKNERFVKLAADNGSLALFLESVWRSEDVKAMPTDGGASKSFRRLCEAFQSEMLRSSVARSTLASLNAHPSIPAVPMNDGDAVADEKTSANPVNRLERCLAEHQQQRFLVRSLQCNLAAVATCLRFVPDVVKLPPVENIVSRKLSALSASAEERASSTAASSSNANGITKEAISSISLAVQHHGRFEAARALLLCECRKAYINSSIFMPSQTADDADEHNKAIAKINEEVATKWERIQRVVDKASQQVSEAMKYAKHDEHFTNFLNNTFGFAQQQFHHHHHDRNSSAHVDGVHDAADAESWLALRAVTPLRRSRLAFGLFSALKRDCIRGSADGEVTVDTNEIPLLSLAPSADHMLRSKPLQSVVIESFLEATRMGGGSVGVEEAFSSDSKLSLPAPSELCSDELIMRGVFGSLATEMLLFATDTSEQCSLIFQRIRENAPTDDAIVLYHNAVWKEIMQRARTAKEQGNEGVCAMHPHHLSFLLSVLHPFGPLHSPLIRDYAASVHGPCCGGLPLEASWQRAVACLEALKRSSRARQHNTMKDGNSVMLFYEHLMVLASMVKANAPIENIIHFVTECQTRCELFNGEGNILSGSRVSVALVEEAFTTLLRTFVDAPRQAEEFDHYNHHEQRRHANRMLVGPLKACLGMLARMKPLWGTSGSHQHMDRLVREAKSLYQL